MLNKITIKTFKEKCQAERKEKATKWLLINVKNV